MSVLSKINEFLKLAFLSPPEDLYNDIFSYVRSEISKYYIECIKIQRKQNPKYLLTFEKNLSNYISDKDNSFPIKDYSFSFPIRDLSKYSIIVKVNFSDKNDASWIYRKLLLDLTLKKPNQISVNSFNQHCKYAEVAIKHELLHFLQQLSDQKVLFPSKHILNFKDKKHLYSKEDYDLLEEVESSLRDPHISDDERDFLKNKLDILMQNISKMHDLSDAEFYPSLDQVINEFIEKFETVSDQDKREYLISFIGQKENHLTNDFFSLLKDNNFGKYQRAVKRLLTELQDRLNYSL